MHADGTGQNRTDVLEMVLRKPVSVALPLIV